MYYSGWFIGTNDMNRKTTMDVHKNVTIEAGNAISAICGANIIATFVNIFQMVRTVGTKAASNILLTLRNPAVESDLSQADMPK